MFVASAAIKLKYMDFSVSPIAFAKPSAPFCHHQGGTTLPDRLAGCVVALGNFDGLHRGHQAVLAKACALAQAIGRPAAFLTFEPHPRRFFRPDEPLFCLTPPDVKALIAQCFGLDGMITLPFDQTLAQTAAQSFIEDLLIGGLGVGGLVIGHDFHFGKGREGSPAMIETIGQRLGLPVAVVPAFTQGDAPVSSSLIREALRRGDVQAAAEMLGYQWFVRGVVRHGDKRGRELGYPTANMHLAPDCGLRYGIYAVRMAVEGRIYNGVASFGSRPTFDDGAPRLETFLFDFEGDLYDRVVDVELVGYVREEAKFSTVEALIAQMDQDSLKARALLAQPLASGVTRLLPLP